MLPHLGRRPFGEALSWPNAPAAGGRGRAVGQQEGGGRSYLFFSLCALFFFSGSSSLGGEDTERGQELRVAGIYELRVQRVAFGRGGGKGAPFAKTIFNFF